MSVVLVTGANGFVGRFLCKLLSVRGYTVRRAVRTLNHEEARSLDDTVAVGEIGSSTDWRAALEGVDAVVHLAARVHVLDERESDPLAAFREVNTLGTLRLAEQAVKSGVRRIVYVSSIKAATNRTGDSAASESDPPDPQDPYGQSKLEAETGLRRIAAGGSLETVLVRPPLVYGPGVGANFLRMLAVVKRGIPLPFGSIRNRRSLVSVTNLCDFISCCLTKDAAIGEVFYVSDGVDLSTPELLQKLGDAIGRRARLFSLPPELLKRLFQIMGRPDDYDRLCGSLHISIEKSRDLLGWTPPETMDEALQGVVDWYNHGCGAR